MTSGEMSIVQRHLRTVSVNGEKPGHETDAISPDKKKMRKKEKERETETDIER